uniref:Coenzyme PQQ synthesis protein B n=1 Tax=Serratia marcescens TaxID=615 RepID=Q0GFB6_SERMA|nr:PqqB [Serratia marcescens]
MQIKVLGSAAGGGFPQWNCNCDNCRAFATQHQPTRTQSSIAISTTGKNWVLCNVSPDILPSTVGLAELNNPDVLLGTGIGAIVLTDSQIDHSAGLLNLREGCPHQVWCTPEVHDDLSTGFPVFPMLSHWNGGLIHHPVTPGEPFHTRSARPCALPPFRCSATAALFAVQRSRCRDNVALFIEDTHAGSGCCTHRAWVSRRGPNAVLRRADCLLIDGTCGATTSCQRRVGAIPARTWGIWRGGRTRAAALLATLPPGAKSLSTLTIPTLSSMKTRQSAKPDRRRH